MNLLMGTARPIVDAEQNNGTFYSPRRVGAGLVDAQGATTSSVYPSVVGAVDPSRPKADLGDGTSGWTFQVTLTNVSDTARTYTLGGQALSEKVESMLFTHHSMNWAGQGIDLTFSSDSVTVPAKGSTTVTVTVTPARGFRLVRCGEHAQGHVHRRRGHLYGRRRRSEPHRPLRGLLRLLGCACDLRPGHPRATTSAATGRRS